VTEIADPLGGAKASVATSLAALGLLGIAALLVTGIALRMHEPHWNSFVLLLVLSGFIAMAATKSAEKAPVGLGLAIVIVVAVAMRLIVLGEDPILSDDIYRYIWDGRVQGAGINPYRYVPADPVLSQLRDALIFPKINRADYAATIYPPVAQFFYFAVTRLSESVTAMRLAFIGCEVVTLLVLVDLLRRFNKPGTLAVAYAWHPLAVWEIANSGHVDALMVMLVMIGVWLLVRYRRVAAGVLIALAALAKPYAIVALPACWRPWDWRLPLVVALTIVACYLPYIGAGEGVFGFLLNGYLQEEGFRGGDGFWLIHAVRTAFGDVPGLLPLYVALAAATLGFLALRSAFAPEVSPERSAHDVAILIMAGLFFLSPNYPWYYLAVVPFIPIGGGAPAWALTIGALLLNLLYPDFGARFLLWKGVISLSFLIAVLASTKGSARLSVSIQRYFRWIR
jgi:hypothetical protein